VAYLSLLLAGSVLAFVAARSLSASGPGFLLFCGAAFRLTLLLRPPDLSEDVWRYLWDARVARAGISPWQYAPDDPALANLAPTLKARVAHRDIRTVYPPAAQAVFRAAGSSGRPFWLKAGLSAADLGIVAMLAGAGLPGGAFAAALYAFHPLPVTETSGQGHVDALGAALLVASVCHALRGRRVSAGLALGLSVLTKYVSVAAVPALLRRSGWRAALAAGVSGAALWAAASRGGISPAGGLDQFATRWEFNSILYPAAFRMMEATELPQSAKEIFIDWKERHHDPPWTQKVFPYFYSAFFARALLGGLLVLLLASIAWRGGDLWGGVLASLGALLLLSPTFHPWYALWLLPFAAARSDAAFLWLATAAPAAYLIAYPIAGVPAAAVSLFEYSPFVCLLGARFLRRSGTGPPT
jgi:alpha-1,6-mannosyltransferase